MTVHLYLVFISIMHGDSSPIHPLLLNDAVHNVTFSGKWFRYWVETLPWEIVQSKQKKILGFSPPANYTDRATAACRRS
jgi:hypothetical protein